MRTALGIVAAAAALGAFAVPADAGCVDDYLAGPDYVAPSQGTVRRNPDGSYTVQPNAVVPDTVGVAGWVAGVTLNEAGRVLVLVDCVK